jgi:chromosome segregation protein
MQGFKSFADKITLTPDRGVTAIVGPNGSGKSNISDAIRWVLGEQSVKSLRGSRMDDVIFSGTEFRKPSGFAEVTLLLDNGDGGLRVPYGDVSVTRRIYRSGESEYLINKNQCRLKDVNELFFDTGIGREGYSIIGQGKVEEILNDKPEERRGIFEEAAGITKYKARRHEAERKLEATSQNLLRINDIIGELSFQMEGLGEQASCARQCLRLRDELKEIEVAGDVLSIGKYEKALAKCEASLETSKGEYAGQAEALSAIEAKVGQARHRASLLDSAQADLNGAILEIEARLSSAFSQISLNEEKSAHAKADIERIAAEIARAGERKRERGAELEANNVKLAYLTGELGRYEKLLGEVKAEYDAVLSALGDSDRAIEGMKRETEDARESYYEDTNRLSAHRAERESFAKAASAVKKNLDAAIRDIDEAGLLKEELDERRNAYSAKASALKKALGGLYDKRSGLGSSLDEKKREAGKITLEMNSKRSRLKILSDMEESFEGFYASVRRVLAECGRSPEFGRGICGAVASLIKVPKELETAVEIGRAHV